MLSNLRHTVFADARRRCIHEYAATTHDEGVLAQSTNYYEVIIIGSGFGGLSAALMLRKLGRPDFRILERRSYMGGTWCQNTYPGAAVDVQSPLYSLASEPYDWTQMFAGQHELEEYTKHVIEKHGLQAHTDTNTQVESLEWDESARRWNVTTNTARQYTARFVINASGPLSTPVIPKIDGHKTCLLYTSPSPRD